MTRRSRGNHRMCERWVAWRRKREDLSDRVRFERLFFFPSFQPTSKVAQRINARADPPTGTTLVAAQGASGTKQGTRKKLQQVAREQSGDLIG